MSGSEAKKQDTFVSVVSPVIGTPEVLANYVREMSEKLRQSYANYELVLVEAGADEAAIDSLSATLEELPCIRMIRLSARSNRDVMLFAGLEAAIGDYVIVMMPGSDPIDAVTDLVAIMRKGSDIVYGLSDVPLRRTFLGEIGARIFYWYGRKYLGLNIPPESTYLVGLNRRSINALTRIKGRYRHVRHLTRQVGFKTAAYRYKPVLNSDSGATRGLVESWRLAKEIVVSYSQHPLRMVSALGLIISGVNLLYAMYAIANYLFNRRVSEGWTTLSLEMAVMFFFLFLILSVICEYLGRILEETRAQPAYHIMEELSSTVLVADETRRNVLT